MSHPPQSPTSTDDGRDLGSHPSEMPALASPFRWAAFGLAAIPLVLLLLASRLEPAQAGLGTHQQLGLPPCSMRVLLGIRCPGCGMTTSWAHFMRAQWLSSFRVNSGGFLLAPYSLAFAWIAIRTSWSGQLPGTRAQRFLGAGLLSIAAVTLVDWVTRLIG